MAFDSLDDDCSGGLDQNELSLVMNQVSQQLSVTAPNEEDLANILMELDDNYDGIIDKNEFCNLVMLVIGRMLETED